MVVFQYMIKKIPAGAGRSFKLLFVELLVSGLFSV
jgi:hypothetical protein